MINWIIYRFCLDITILNWQGVEQIKINALFVMISFAGN